jgi:hypothetical protein
MMSSGESFGVRNHSFKIPCKLIFLIKYDSNSRVDHQFLNFFQQEVTKSSKNIMKLFFILSLVVVAAFAQEAAEDATPAVADVEIKEEVATENNVQTEASNSDEESTEAAAEESTEAAAEESTEAAAEESTEAAAEESTEATAEESTEAAAEESTEAAAEESTEAAAEESTEAAAEESTEATAEESTEAAAEESTEAAAEESTEESDAEATDAASVDDGNNDSDATTEAAAGTTAAPTRCPKCKKRPAIVGPLLPPLPALPSFANFVPFPFFNFFGPKAAADDTPLSRKARQVPAFPMSAPAAGSFPGFPGLGGFPIPSATSGGPSKKDPSAPAVPVLGASLITKAAANPMANPFGGSVASNPGGLGAMSPGTGGFDFSQFMGGMGGSMGGKPSSKGGKSAGAPAMGMDFKSFIPGGFGGMMGPAAQ